MITILALGYAYTVWLFTGHNPMPHLNAYLILFAMPELLFEVWAIVGLFLFFDKER